MAKEKAKYDGLLCFLLAVIVVLVLIIGGGAYYFLITNNRDAINEVEFSTDEKAVELTEEQLDYFTEYFNLQANNGFLIVEYDNIKKAQLDEGILYPFISEVKNILMNNEEKIDVYGDIIDADVYKVTKEQINEFLKKNTGLTLNDFEQGPELGKSKNHRIVYSEKYNAYYMSASGVLGKVKECLAGERDGTKYTLEFTDSIMTLNKEGENFIVFSNIFK